MSLEFGRGVFWEGSDLDLGKKMEFGIWEGGVLGRIRFGLWKKIIGVWNLGGECSGKGQIWSLEKNN